MSDSQKPLHPGTEVLTRGYDPSLSVGSARPAVFRSSTYVFSSPEAAERSFDLMAGRAQKTPGEQIDLVYSRFNHPNAEILEDHMVPKVVEFRETLPKTESGKASRRLAAQSATTTAASGNHRRHERREDDETNGIVPRAGRCRTHKPKPCCRISLANPSAPFLQKASAWLRWS